MNNGPVFALPLLYLDPGSGSFIIQLLLGAGLGLVVGVKMYWAKLKGIFQRKPGAEAQEDAEDRD